MSNSSNNNNNNNNNREQLLDQFPLTDQELDDIWFLWEPPQQSPSQSQSQSQPILDLFSSQCLTGNNEPDLLLVLAHHADTTLPHLDAMLQWARNNVLVLDQPCSDNNSHDERVFFEAIVSLLGRRGSNCLHRLLYYYHHNENDIENGDNENGDNQLPTAEALLQTLHQLVQLNQDLQDMSNENHGPLSDIADQPAPASWVASLLAKRPPSDQNEKNNPTISWTTWNAWLTDCAPWFYTLVPTVVHRLLFPQDQLASFRPGIPWSLTPVYCPLEWTTKNPLSLQSSAHATCLAAMLGPQQHCYALYTSDQHGLSFGRLQQALLGYVGPTLLVCGTSTSGATLGYYTQAPWKSNSHWHGAEDNFDACLFSLQPVWSRYPRTFEETTGRGLQYLSSSSHARKSTATTTNDLTGLAVGGLYPDRPRFHVTESLEQCCVVQQDQAFAAGPLIHTNSNGEKQQDEAVWFDVEWLEVYAVVESRNNNDLRTVFEQQRAAGQHALQVHEWHRQKAAYVDKAQFVDDLAGDGPLGSTKLYGHRDQARGRASFVADDDEGQGYYVEGKKPSPARKRHYERNQTKQDST